MICLWVLDLAKEWHRNAIFQLRHLRNLKKNFILHFSNQHSFEVCFLAIHASLQGDICTSKIFGKSENPLFDYRDSNFVLKRYFHWVRKLRELGKLFRLYLSSRRIYYGRFLDLFAERPRKLRYWYVHLIKKLKILYFADRTYRNLDFIF